VTEVCEPDELDGVLDATMARVAAAPRDSLVRTRRRPRRAGIDLVGTLEL
jgi:hypothetical protein